MWDDKRSLVLSRVCVLIFMALLIVCAALAPRLVERLITLSASAYAAGKTLFLATIYTGCVPAAVLLSCLYLLISRIGREHVFVRANVGCLRHISWCCFAGALICATSAFYYLPWAAVAVPAAFMGLIVRVIKNVFAKAVELQDDAEFTI